MKHNKIDDAFARIPDDIKERCGMSLSDWGDGTRRILIDNPAYISFRGSVGIEEHSPGIVTISDSSVSVTLWNNGERPRMHITVFRED